MVDEAEQLRQRNRELGILHEVAAALNGAVELRDALDTALSKVGELLDLETGWIWLIDPDTGEPYLAAAQRLPPGLANQPQAMEGGCFCLETFRRGDHEGAANINVLTCSRLAKLTDGAEGFRYHASVPLYAGDEKLGVLNLASRDWRELSEAELRILHTISDLLSMAIERTRLFSRSTELGAAQERNRLARDIHDTLAQSLTGIVMQLETADAMLEAHAATDQVQSKVARALELSRQSLEEARRSVHDLRAAPLDSQTLADALAHLCATHPVNRSCAVDYEVVGAHQPLPTRIETGLFRIAQEALTNIAEHAHAKTTRMRLVAEPDQVTLEVRDDGVGFVGGAGGDGSFGLVGMNERARLMGGEFELETSWTKGTRLTVTIPLEEME